MYAREENKQTKQRQIRTNFPLERKKEKTITNLFIFFFLINYAVFMFYDRR